MRIGNIGGCLGELLDESVACPTDCIGDKVEEQVLSQSLSIHVPPSVTCLDLVTVSCFVGSARLHLAFLHGYVHMFVSPQNMQRKRESYFCAFAEKHACQFQYYAVCLTFDMLIFRQTSKAECVVLLENVRFHKGETKNDPAFAEKVSLLYRKW